MKIINDNKISKILNFVVYLLSTIFILWMYLDRIVTYMSSIEINFIKLILINFVGIGCWTVFINVLVKKSLESITTNPTLKSVTLGIIVFVPFIIIIIDRFHF